MQVLLFGIVWKTENLTSDEKYLTHFVKYENEFKRAKSLREFLKSNEDYPKEIFGEDQVIRLNPRPIHYEF